MQDRRTRNRYPLRLRVEYQTRRGDTGAGIIVEMSTRSARLELDRCPPVLTALRLNVAWPAKLNGSTALQIRIDGRVIRAEKNFVVVEFKGYDIVTAAKGRAVRRTASASEEGQ